MPSYLEKEQIQPIQPYIDNTSAILNTFQTKLNYWGAGAAQLRAAQEKYLGMDLLRDDNRDRLKTFMSQAKEQIKKATQSDLSIGDNQVEALGIFDPLVDGQSDFSKAILADNAIASHYKSELTTANTYRTKDGGKEYSDTNVQYLMQHMNDFQKDPDALNGSKYYASRRFYSPYYDHNKEIKEIMAAYKPSVKRDTIPTTGMYFMSTTDESSYKDDVMRYVSANLSDRAKRQLAIEASVNWYGRENDLIKSVQVDWEADIAKYTSYTNSLDALILTEDDPVKKANLEAEAVVAKRRIATLQDNILKYNSGDFSEILSNKESYANKLYLNNYLNSIASGYARTDYERKYSVDNASVQTMLEAGRNSRFVMEMNYNRERDALDRQTTLEVARLRGDGTKSFNPIPGVDQASGYIPVSESNKEKISVSIEGLDSEKDAVSNDQVGYYELVHNMLVNEGKITKEDSPDKRHQIAQQWLKKMDETYSELSKNYKDPAVVKFSMEYNYFPGVMDLYNGLKASNQKLFAINQVKEELIQKGMKEIRGLAESGKTTISYKDKKKGASSSVYISPEHIVNYVMKGDRSIIKEHTRELLKPGEPPLSKVAQITGYRDEKYYTYNGREIDRFEFNKLVKTVKSNLNSKYKSEFATGTPIWKFGPSSKIKQDVANSEILANVSVGGKELKPVDYQILGYNEDGTIFFKSDKSLDGVTYKGDKDSDGRTIYGINSPSFKIDVNQAIPDAGRGVKYYIDKFIPFLKPGEIRTTPKDKNFFKIGNRSFQVDYQLSPDGLSVNYTLYRLEDDRRKSPKTFRDIYTLLEFAQNNALQVE